MYCRYCGGVCVKDGLQSNKVQRYKCKECLRRQQENYRYKAYDQDIDRLIVMLTREGVSIRGLARCIGISCSTILARIRKIADEICAPPINVGSEYEVDEMWTFLKNKHKPLWIAYALDRNSKDVISFNVGGRSIEMMTPVLDVVKEADPKKVYTDYLVHYLSLVPSHIHVRGKCGTNHIERHNLNMRTHLKRLSRKTICFTRSVDMLVSILKIYFWGAKV